MRGILPYMENNVKGKIPLTEDIELVRLAMERRGWKSEMFAPCAIIS
jgi:hypothetical protein